MKKESLYMFILFGVRILEGLHFAKVSNKICYALISHCELISIILQCTM